MKFRLSVLACSGASLCVGVSCGERAEVAAPNDAAAWPDSADASYDARPDADALDQTDVAQEENSLPDSETFMDAPDSVEVDADGGCAPARRTGSVASSFQINPAHDGIQPLDQLTLPLCMRWAVRLESPSFPVVANGRVFVTTMDESGSVKNALYALDELTGNKLWGPVPLGGIPIGDAGQKSSWSAPALDGDTVFVVNVVGTIRAFSQTTGALLWEKTIPGTGTDGLFATAPVAVGGVVYVAPEGGKVYGFDGATGADVWSANAKARRFVAPSISGATLFVSEGCSSAQAVDLLTGAPVWTGSSSCRDAFSAGISGGGGGIPIYSGGRLYTRSIGSAGNAFGWAYDARNGMALDAIPGGPAPVVTAKLGYFVSSGGDLQAFAPTATSPAWEFRGYGIYVPPLVVGDGVVVAGSPYGLWVLDAASGAKLGHAVTFYPPVPANENNFNNTEGGLAAADGMLFVPTLSELLAY